MEPPDFNHGEGVRFERIKKVYEKVKNESSLKYLKEKRK